MSGFDLTARDDYRRFLKFQYAARLPVEAWLSDRAPDIDLPEMAPLIAADLAALDTVPPATRDFAMTDATGALGVAWALAGSHLGNRALLVRMRKAGAENMPVNFLSETAMRAAWQRLLPALETPAERQLAAKAAAAAEAVFAHFALCLDDVRDSAERLAA